MFLLVGFCFDAVLADFAKSKTKTSFSSFQVSPSILEFYDTFSNIDWVSLIFSCNFWLLVLHFLKLKWLSKNLNFNFLYNSNAVSIENSPQVKPLIKNDSKVFLT